MLTITIPLAEEQWDEEKQEFISGKEQTLVLEHSLLSLSKWESKYCKPFLSKDEKTFEETLDYIRFMTITRNVDPSVYNRLTVSNIEEINQYIASPQTATTISESGSSKASREIVTSELIYYWMISLQIPIDECQKWHLNRLLTLIRVCSIKNQPPKKKGKRAVANQYAALNAARRKQLNSKG